MNEEKINGVGSRMLSLSCDNTFEFSVNKRNSTISAMINKWKEMTISANHQTQFGVIESSFGNKNPILAYRPCTKNNTTVEFSLLREDVSNLNLKFSYPFTICKFPIKLHAECIKNKTHISIETEKEFSTHILKKPLNGVFKFKYGKCIESNIRFNFPYFDTLFSIDENTIFLRENIGIPTAFISYLFSYDYLSIGQQIGAFSSYKNTEFSANYDLKTKCYVVKTEKEIDKGIFVGGSFISEGKNEVGKENIRYEIGGCIESPSALFKHVGIKGNIPSNEIFLGFEIPMKNIIINLTGSYRIPNKSFGVGMSFVYNEV